MISFDPNDEQRELQMMLRRWADDHEADMAEGQAGLPTEWAELADLGILALGTPGGGGAIEIHIAMRELGRIGCPGPLVPTILAASLLDGDQRERVVNGTSIAAVVVGSLLPWGPIADVVLEIGDSDAWLVNVVNSEPVDTVIGEPCSQVVVERTAPLFGVTDAVALGEIAAASYLTGAAERELEIVADYARDRRQFGRSIGSFQAVAHPIADAYVWVRAATALTAVAAAQRDDLNGDERNRDDYTPRAEKAVFAAKRSALDACYTAHQAMGAIGFTNEGSLARLTLRIRQLALSCPSSDTSTFDSAIGLI